MALLAVVALLDGSVSFGQSALLFEDTFESGSLGDWDQSYVPAGGSLALTPAAALSGALGLEVTAAADSTFVFAATAAPTAETSLHLALQLDPNSLQMAAGESLTVASGVSAGTLPFDLRLGWSGSTYQIRAFARQDDGTFDTTAWVPIADGPVDLWIEWWAAGEPGADDGGLRLWKGEEPVASIQSLDNDDMAVDTVRVGIVGGLDPGTLGQIYIDDVRVFRGSDGRKALLADSFESGDLTSWEASQVTGGGSLAATTAAAIDGSHGLAVELSPSSTYVLVRSVPIETAGIDVSFLLNPSTLSMAPGTDHAIFAAVAEVGLAADLRLGYDNGSFRLKAVAFLDGSGNQSTPWQSIGSGVTTVRLRFAASVPKASTGRLKLWVNGQEVGALSGLLNREKAPLRLRLGATGGLDTTTQGTYFLDEFRAWEADRPVNWWQRSGYATDSAFWWTLAPELSPPALKAELTSFEAHRQRYAAAAPLVQPDEVARVAEFVSGRQSPKLIPFWLAFDALAARLVDGPEGLKKPTEGMLLAAGLSQADLAQVHSAAQDLRGSEIVQRAVIDSALSDLHQDVMEPASIALGTKVAVEARQGKDAAMLALGAGLPEAQVESLLDAALQDSTAVAALPVVTSLKAQLSPASWLALRNVLRSEVAPGILSQKIEAASFDAFGPLPFRESARVRITDAEYSREAGVLGDPGIWQVVVSGEMKYVDESRSDLGRTMIIGCSIWDSTTQSTRYEYLQNSAVLIRYGQTLRCSGVEARIPRCLAGNVAAGYYGRIDGAIGVFNADFASVVMPVRTATCDQFYQIGGTVSGLATNDLVNLQLSWTAPDSSSDTWTNTRSNGSFAFNRLQNGTTFSLGLSQTLQGKTCNAQPASGAIEDSDVNITVTCSGAGPYTVGGRVRQIEPADDLITAFLLAGPTAEDLAEVETRFLGSGSPPFTFSQRLEDGTFYRVRAESSNRYEVCNETSGQVDGANVTVDLECVCAGGTDYCHSNGETQERPEPTDPGNPGNTVIEPFSPIGEIWRLLDWLEPLDGQGPRPQDHDCDNPPGTWTPTVPCPQEYCPSAEPCPCEQLHIQCSNPSPATGNSIQGPVLSVTIEDAPGGVLLANDQLRFRASATDVNGVAGFFMILDGQLYWDYPYTVPGGFATLPFGSISTVPLADGHHSLAIVAVGDHPDAMVASGVIIRFRVDRGPGGSCGGDTAGPVVGLVSPPFGAQIAPGTITVHASVQDSQSGVAYVDFFADGTLLSRDTASPFLASWNATLGEHSLYAVAADTCGNTTTSQLPHPVTVQVSCESVPPYVALVNPQHGEVLAPGEMSFAVSASDSGSGIDLVELFLDGQTYGTDFIFPYRYSWTATEGSHSVSARAVDGCGNEAQTTLRTFQVHSSCEGVNPSVTLTSPAHGAQLPAGNVSVAATAADNVGVVRVEFLVDGALRYSDTSAPYTWTWVAGPGQHSVQARAVDGCGNSALSAASVVTVFSPDQTGPTVTLTAPAHGSTVPAGAVTLQATASDTNSQVEFVRFRVDGVTVRTDPFPPYRYVLTLGPGTYSIQAEAEDSAGNLGQSAVHTLTVTDPCTGDSSGPSISIFSPESGLLDLGDGTLSVIANASDANGIAEVEFFVDGALIGTQASPQSGTYYWQNWNIPGPAHTYTIQARGEDGCGNLAWSQTVDVTVRIILHD